MKELLCIKNPKRHASKDMLAQKQNMKIRHIEHRGACCNIKFQNTKVDLRKSKHVPKLTMSHIKYKHRQRKNAVYMGIVI